MTSTEISWRRLEEDGLCQFYFKRFSSIETFPFAQVTRSSFALRRVSVFHQLSLQCQWVNCGQLGDIARTQEAIRLILLSCCCHGIDSATNSLCTHVRPLGLWRSLSKNQRNTNWHKYSTDGNLKPEFGHRNFTALLPMSFHNFASLIFFQWFQLAYNCLA